MMHNYDKYTLLPLYSLHAARAQEFHMNFSDVLQGILPISLLVTMVKHLCVSRKT